MVGRLPCTMLIQDRPGTDPGSIPGIPYGPQNLPRAISELRARSNP